MTNLRQTISLVLCPLLVITQIGLEGCKKESKAQQDQAPPVTYAAPSPDQLYQLVAPIALFPDNLVAQVLAAATYPDQITAAWNWLQQNRALQGQQLMQAVNEQNWDVSVKGLTQFSDVLQQMAGNLSWTSALGDAYYNSPQNVMNAVQVMRQRAYDAGNLKSTPQQNVSVQNQAPAQAPAAPSSSGGSQVTVVQSPPQTIVIQPSQPDVVYVPTYNPTAVYGAPVPAYPGYSTGDMVATGLISFGVGMMVGAAMNNSCCGWGWNSWGCGWNNSSVTFNRNVYVSNSNTFVNRNNYYNRNNINTANINRNNINTNNINRNDINRNNVNRNDLNRNNVNRGGSFSTPHFDQSRNQSQFRDQGRGNAAQQRPTTFDQQRGNLGQQRAGNQPSINPNNRAGGNQIGQGPRAQGGVNQNNRQDVRGYGNQASNRAASNSGLGNYGQGGNARANSARGEQSFNGGGNRSANTAARSGGGAAANRGAGGAHGRRR